MLPGKEAALTTNSKNMTAQSKVWRNGRRLENDILARTVESAGVSLIPPFAPYIREKIAYSGRRQPPPSPAPFTRAGAPSERLRGRLAAFVRARMRVF